MLDVGLTRPILLIGSDYNFDYNALKRHSLMSRLLEDQLKTTHKDLCQNDED